MKGYKVVKLGPKGGLTSAIVDRKALVRYRKDRPNKAPKWLAEKGYHLIIFTNLRLARSWTLKNNRLQIWLSEVRDVFNPKKLCNIFDLCIGKISEEMIGWPKGTKMAKRVYLVRRID
jgi:hypothetical protein